MANNKKWFLVLSLLLVLIGAVVAGCSASQDADTQAETQPLSQRNNVTNENIVVISNQPLDPVANGPSQTGTATPLPPSSVDQARAVETVLINIYQRVNPSVVNIEVVERSSNNDIFDSSGSGFVYDRQGHIVTNAHVVLEAREILVTFSDGSVAEAELVGIDEYSDLAVIHVDVDPEYLFPVEVGDSSTVQVGQYVVAIGNPFGLRSSMTTGIVSATGRTLASQFLINPSTQDIYSNPAIIQIDAAVNPGNSGGPVMDLDGRVIGVTTAIRSDTGTFQGVAYAVPANTLNQVAPQLIANGEVAYPWLGIVTPRHSEPGLSMPALASELNLPVRNGVLIMEVEPGSPAERAGLQGGTPESEVVIRGRRIWVDGDIIVAINGEFIFDLDELMEYLIQNTSPGDVITLTVVRDNQTLEVPLELGQRPN